MNPANPKKTLVLGASPNPERYAYLATKMLTEHGHPVVPFGLKSGIIAGVSIVNELPQSVHDIDTVTIYLGPSNQTAYYQYVLDLKPRRVIFNPGTENADFEQLLIESDIKPLEACTLVLLRTGNY